MDDLALYRFRLRFFLSRAMIALPCGLWSFRLVWSAGLLSELAGFFMPD
jgi:hypothetical protein